MTTERVLSETNSEAELAPDADHDLWTFAAAPAGARARAVVLLHEVEGYTHRELAELFGQTESYPSPSCRAVCSGCRGWLGTVSAHESSHESAFLAPAGWLNYLSWNRRRPPCAHASRLPRLRASATAAQRIGGMALAAGLALAALFPAPARPDTDEGPGGPARRVTPAGAASGDRHPGVQQRHAGDGSWKQRVEAALQQAYDQVPAGDLAPLWRRRVDLLGVLLQLQQPEQQLSQI